MDKNTNYPTGNKSSEESAEERDTNQQRMGKGYLAERSECGSPLFGFKRPDTQDMGSVVSSYSSPEDNFGKFKKDKRHSMMHLPASQPPGHGCQDSTHLDPAIICIEDTPVEDQNQVVIIDSSMETSDESSQQNNGQEKRVKDESKIAIKRYSITRSIIERLDTKVEEIVNGIVVNTTHYCKENVMDSKVEIKEEETSGTSSLSVASQLHYSGDVSSSTTDEKVPGETEGNIRRNVTDDVIRLPQRQTMHSIPDPDINVILPPNIFFSSSNSSSNSLPREFPTLGSSPVALNGGDKSQDEEGLFKLPDVPLLFGQRVSEQTKRSDRFSSSTAISDEDRLSLAGKSYFPSDVSSIRQSVEASINHRFISLDGEKFSLDVDPRESRESGLYGAIECSTSSSLISDWKSNKNSTRSEELSVGHSDCGTKDHSSLFSEPSSFSKLLTLHRSKKSSIKFVEAEGSKESMKGTTTSETSGTSDPPAMPSSTDIIPPTGSEVSDKEMESNYNMVGDGSQLRKRVRRPRLAIRRYSMIRRPSILMSPLLEAVREKEGNMDNLPPKTLKQGTLVYTRWTDNHFYPGRVDQLVTPDDGDDSKVMILFDDGNLYEAVRGDVIVCDLVPMGSVVMAQRSETEMPMQTGFSTPRGKRAEWSEEGVITAHITRADGSKSYLVKFESDKDVCLQRKHVTLTMSQARRIFGLGFKSLDFQRSQTISPDVTTDNVLVGKRKRRQATPLSQSEWRDSSQEMAGMTSPKRKRTLPTLIWSNIASSTPRARKRKYTHTKEEQEKFDPIPPVIICSPNRHLRPVGRPAIKALDLNFFSNYKSTIFSGLTFLITHVWKSSYQLEKEKLLLTKRNLPPNSCESSDDDISSKSMDRELVVTLIKSGGGIILDDFTIEGVSSCMNSCYLVSDSAQRTVKYICSLAFGVPCVSYQWIRKSCSANKLEDHRRYLLPVGYSIEKNLILTRHDQVQPSPLDGLHLILRLRDDLISNTWKKVLQAAGCRTIIINTRSDEGFVNQLRNFLQKSTSINKFFVTDSSVQDNHRTIAKEVGITLVTTEWVVQSIVNGYMVDPTGSEKYRP